MNLRVLHIFLLFSIVVCPHQKALGQVLNYETKITIDTKSRKTLETTVLLQVNDKQANWLSHVEIRHRPKQDFSFNYARIIDHNGNILRKFKKRDLKTRNDLSYKAYYQDDLITDFDLYWNQYPYRIEYSYTIVEEEFLSVVWWTPYLFSNVPTMESSLEINAPPNYKMHISQSGDLIYKESKTEDRKIYYWESTIVNKIKDEIYSPPLRELYPMVIVVPSKFKYWVSGSFDSWSTYGSWLSTLNKGIDQLPLSEKITVDKLIEGIDDKKEIIKRIYYYLQDHTKYINVAIDVGGLKSYPASYVCRNKYGDCKALTTYMKSMLKSVDIDSYYTVINAGKNEAKIKNNFPSQQFNHVILTIPLEHDTIWLENTSNALPYNYIGTFIQNRYALVVNEEKSELVLTPKLHPLDVLVQRNYVFNVDEIGDCHGDITLNLRGSPYEAFRYSLSNESEADQKLEIINLIDINGFDLGNWNTIDYHRDSSNVKIHASGDCTGQIRKIGKWEVINPLKIQLPDFAKPDKRHLDIRINYPINKSDRTVYRINKLDSKEVKIPEGITITSNYGQYHTKYLKENNSIIAYEKFTLLENDISIDNYPEFYSFIQSIIDHKKKTAILIK